jgi:hypothetical protein
MSTRRGSAPTRRCGTELLEDSEHVELGAFLDDLAVGEAIERHALRDDGLAGGWDPVELARWVPVMV